MIRQASAISRFELIVLSGWKVLITSNDDPENLRESHNREQGDLLSPSFPGIRLRLVSGCETGISGFSTNG